MLITVQPNPSWQLSLAQLSPSLLLFIMYNLDFDKKWIKSALIKPDQLQRVMVLTQLSLSLSFSLSVSLECFVSSPLLQDVCHTHSHHMLALFILKCSMVTMKVHILKKISFKVLFILFIYHMHSHYHDFKHKLQYTVWGSLDLYGALNFPTGQGYITLTWREV